ncbi:hypothetical protein SAMN06295885_2097 [Rathayibacter oskolensis]|uniref:Uncharacterized protein n=1 Tax=Rathayibacter oskolensis TaxID=1891671 RepID=A0A1X7NZR1_9MICO|nr:hypothetical protein [Rathayibacter oskolensis]SMH42911.1 hypothetical protein SAMN06295885_2097 [Rathayibacter oskolensis]
MVLALLLAGCTASTSDPAVTAPADLDRETGQIHFPLEDYVMSAAEAALVQHANDVLVGACMAEQGLPYPQAEVDWVAEREASPTPDRPYGLWAMEEARTNGYETPLTPAAAALEAQHEALGTDWWATARTCLRTSDTLPTMVINSTPEPTIADKGSLEARSDLLAGAEFSRQRTLWTECIEEEGLTALPSDEVLIPDFDFAAAGPEQVAIAVIDVTCKDQLGTVDTLAALETRIQLDFIDAHRSELQQLRDDVDEVIREARRIT